MPQTNTRIRTLALVSGAVVMLSLTACGGGELGAELTAQPKPTVLRSDPDSVLRLPGDEKFNVTFAPSSREPGLGGTAEADAHASTEGEADAIAKVDTGGKANAMFQLGHAFKNESTRQIDTEIRLRFKYEFTAAARPQPDAPGGSIGVKLYARNAKKVLVRTLDLLGHTTANGSASRSGEDDLTCSLTLAPGDSMTVFLSGFAGAEAREDSSAEARIKLSGVQMEIQSKPAPAVPAAGSTTQPASTPRTTGDGPQ